MVTALYLLSLVMAIIFAILLDGPVVLMLRLLLLARRRALAEALHGVASRYG